MKMNRKLVARFLASVDPKSLPSATTPLEDLDTFEVQEILEQSITGDYGPQRVFLCVVPGPIKNGLYTMRVYEFDKETWKLKPSNYTLESFTVLSKILEKIQWDGAQWVSKERIEEALKHIPETDDD